MSAQMKDKLRELVVTMRASSESGTQSQRQIIEYWTDRFAAIIDAEGDGGAVGEYVANVDKYGGILWLNGPPAHGTKIYTHPARSGVVSEEAVRDAERYRWLLKTVDHDCEYQSLEDLAWYALHNESSEKITKAIDAAIQGERHEL